MNRCYFKNLATGAVMSTGNLFIEYVLLINKLDFAINKALFIASTGGDFEVRQVIDRTLYIQAMIPKSIFTKKKFPYWT
jgi:acetamidase/formamidase